MEHATRHLRLGWWSLFGWLLLGLGLETMHGFKAGWYLDVGQETRRLMLTLAHAHGTLLGLVNIAAGVTLKARPFAPGRASGALLAGALLLPLGFLLGGLVTNDGDPGLGIVLVPVGGLLVAFGVFGFARGQGKKSDGCE
jgi:hypothetical protein